MRLSMGKNGIINRWTIPLVKFFKSSSEMENQDSSCVHRTNKVAFQHMAHASTEVCCRLSMTTTTTYFRGAA